MALAPCQQEEIDRILEDFPKNKEEFPKLNLFLYELKSELSVASVIASILARLYPDDIVIIRKKKPNGWKLSMRCQSGKTNLNDIAKKCSEGIGSGGGHPKAAGAFIYDWDVFKECLLRELESSEQ